MFATGMYAVLVICLAAAGVVKVGALKFALPRRYGVYLSLLVIMDCFHFAFNLFGSFLVKHSNPEYLQHKHVIRYILKQDF